MEDLEQPMLLDIEEPWRKEWIGMPEFVQHDLTPWKQIQISFMSPGDMQDFADLIGQTITPNTRIIWFPNASIEPIANKRYGHEA